MTIADEAVQQAKSGISEALNGLKQIVVDRCWGFDEYNQDYRETLRAAYAELIEIRDRLDPT